MAKNSAASISLPVEIIKEVERMAKTEHKTRSGIIQDAVRSYIELRKWFDLQQRLSAQARSLKLNTDDDVERLVDEVRS